MEWAGWLGWLRDIVHRRSARRSRKVKERLAEVVADRDRHAGSHLADLQRIDAAESEANCLRAERDALARDLERAGLQVELLRMQVEHSGAMIGVQRDWIESFRAHPNEGRIP